MSVSAKCIRRCYDGVSAKLLVFWRLRSQTVGLLRNALWWRSAIQQRRWGPVRLWSRLQSRKTSTGTVTIRAAALCLATGLERASLGSLLHLNATLEAPECAELFYRAPTSSSRAMRRGDCGEHRKAAGATEKGVKTLESSFRAAFVLAVP
jgi:hypothetical protein